MDAGLLIDLPHLSETGAQSIGLFRTELQFMLASRFPRLSAQEAVYRSVLDAAGERPVTFRTLDIGGDKVLPYMRGLEEENPALGWRAIRIGSIVRRCCACNCARCFAPPQAAICAS